MILHWILEAIRNLPDAELTAFLLLLFFIPLVVGLAYGYRRGRVCL